MRGNQTSIPDIEERIFLMEETMGVSQKDHEDYLKLTPLRWLFALEWTNPNEVPDNLSLWSEEKGFRRRDIYAWQNDPKVAKVIRRLSSPKNITRASALADSLFKKASHGDVKATQLYWKYYPPVDTVGEDEEMQEIRWDTSLTHGKPAETQTKSDTPPETSN